MNLEEYLYWIRDAPLPSDQQYARFAYHLARVHSWYKGDLRNGSDFLVYLDPRLGAAPDDKGQHVVDLTRTIKEYRADYGCLAYRWRRRRSVVAGSDTPPELPAYSDYRVDTIVAGEVVQSREYSQPDLPREIIKQCSFVLYPYVNAKKFFEVAEVAKFHHLKELRAIWAGRPHPRRRALVFLQEEYLNRTHFDYETEWRPVWDAITAREYQDERDTTFGAVAGSAIDSRRLRWAMNHAQLNERQRLCARSLWCHYRKLACLERPEFQKINIALANLRDLIKRALCEDSRCRGVLRPAPPNSPYRDVAEAVCPVCKRRQPLPGPE